MRGKLIVGNWKMNGGLATNSALLVALLAGWKAPAGRTMGVCVPFPYLGQARDALQDSAIAWGAQDVSAHAAGAYTGEVSAGMLAEFGCGMVLVGHSERRQLHGETDGMVAAKAVAALNGGLTPVVCLGETLAERDAGQTLDVVGRQFDAVAATLGDAPDAGCAGLRAGLGDRHGAHGNAGRSTGSAWILAAAARGGGCRGRESAVRGQRQGRECRGTFRHARHRWRTRRRSIAGRE